ncbi:uncharacterized protein C2orf42 homolog [Episyrphus balteatus]|uniref:uncharacterized protein C2orf42 homolog n=1 Tax=Episyrphus balteatus TaxID=286459 RepID=UPI002485984A|nr:uncharacterized protein C2orf42 homolog [Episyrphus balteatus]
MAPPPAMIGGIINKNKPKMLDQHGHPLKLMDIASRRSLRGLKRCPSCGTFNGNRSQMCRNLQCELRKQILNTKKSMDPIQLISHTDSKMYSVRIKERDCAPRNFVQITDSYTQDGESLLIKRKAICFVDTCKYDSKDVDISCKHVKATSECVKIAEEFTINYDALWNLPIDVEQKVRLWDMYKEEESAVPAVQRINNATFVTKCASSNIFPSGRLHVTALTNDKKIENQTFSCACKKLKILMSPNDSVSVKEDICDHLVLVLAAVLSRSAGSPAANEFSNFTKELMSAWITETIKPEPVIVENTSANGDIFIFDNELLPTDDLSDFTDNILKSVLNDENANSNTHQNMYQGDPSMVSGCTTDDADIPFEAISCIDVMNEQNTRLELSDCNIELMDQFELTNQIDLCNNGVILSNDDLFQGNSIVMPDLSDTIIDDLIVAQNQTQQIQPSQLMLPITPLPIVENTSATVRISKKKPKKINLSQSPKKAVDVVPVLDVAKRLSSGPSLEYVMWLDHVIECINMNVDFNLKEPNVSLNFNVHEDVFAHFSASFTNGVKCRLPNSTVVIKKGKFKGLLKYTWILQNASKVQNIFKTKNMAVEVERKFQPNGDKYVPYVEEKCDIIVVNKKFKKICPKMYVAHIWFDCSNNNQKTGFKIEWVPNVFPKSGFGVLNIEFSIGLRH